MRGFFAGSHFQQFFHRFFVAGGGEIKRVFNPNKRSLAPENGGVRYCDNVFIASWYIYHPAWRSCSFTFSHLKFSRVTLSPNDLPASFALKNIFSHCAEVSFSFENLHQSMGGFPALIIVAVILYTRHSSCSLLKKTVRNLTWYSNGGKLQEIRIYPGFTGLRHYPALTKYPYSPAISSASSTSATHPYM